MLLVLVAGAALAEGEPPPGEDFLEFLGSWPGADADAELFEFLGTLPAAPEDESRAPDTGNAEEPGDAPG